MKTLFYAAESAEGRTAAEAPLASLAALVDSGALEATTLVWTDEMEEWAALGEPATLAALEACAGAPLDEGVIKAIRSGLSSPAGSAGSGSVRSLSLREGGSPERAATPPAAEQPRLSLSPRSDTASSPSSPASSAAGSATPTPTPPFCSLRYCLDPATEGPSEEVGVAALRRLLSEGTIDAQCLVWSRGMEDWAPLVDCYQSYGLVRAELGIMRQHLLLEEAEAEGAEPEVRSAVAGTDWERVETAGEEGSEVYFVHRASGETSWSLPEAAAASAREAAAGAAKPGGWLRRENASLAAENERLRGELAEAVAGRAAARRAEAALTRQLAAAAEENAALRARLEGPREGCAP